MLEEHAVVEFSIGHIVGLELHAFNHQNVFDGLTLSHVDAGRNGQAIALRIAPTYGLSGFIHAKEVSVTFRPGHPRA